MDSILIIITICGIIFGIVSFFYWKHIAKVKQKEKYYESLKEDYLQKIRKENETVLQDLNAQREVLQKNLTKLTDEISTKTNFNESLFKIREEELNRIIEEKKKEKVEVLNREIKDWAKSAQEAATYTFNLSQNELIEKINNKKEELEKIQIEIQNYQEKRNVINQEILRTRAIEEQQDFYTLQLDKDSQHDIEILKNIIPKIIKVDNLNKLLYDNYISKPVKELVKRVLEGKNPSGIYKVTNLKTKEVYIGKSTNIADRWKNHIKSAYGLSGVADSQFQRALKKDGVENFSWELLEEVPKEKLTEREKYYINFYDTLHYGYNMRNG